MSVFKPENLPNLKAARGRSFYILHSPEDFIPIEMAEDARDELVKKGAKVEYQTYAGGHGWHGDVFGTIRSGIGWLEKQAKTYKPAK
jgi:predicted esterase